MDGDGDGVDGYSGDEDDLGGMTRVLVSPTHIPRSPSSQPAITWPTPRVNWNGLFLEVFWSDIFVGSFPNHIKYFCSPINRTVKLLPTAQLPRVVHCQLVVVPAKRANPPNYPIHDTQPTLKGARGGSS